MHPKPDSCIGCPLYTLGEGFIAHPDGMGSSGVILVGEAPGEKEVRKSRPFVGATGFAMQRLIQRKGWQRDEFVLANCLSCKPPGNLLRGMPYTSGALEHCRPNLDRAFSHSSLPKAAVALGGFAVRQLLGLDRTPILDNYRGYTHWSERYQMWVVATYHPAYLLRGKWHLAEVWQQDVEKARRIAREGYQPFVPETVCDPSPEEFGLWVDEALRSTNPIAYDIETPYSGGKGEDKIDDPSYNILRVSFACRRGQGVSVPWAWPYIDHVKRLMAGSNTKLVWNAAFDNPRLESAGVVINGEIIDGLWQWHELQSALPKGLGYVVPCLLPHYPMWKHLSRENPAFYSAVDAAATWDLHEPLMAGVKGLPANITTGWSPQRHFDRHVTQLTPILNDMNAVGVLVDHERRKEVAKELEVIFLAEKARLQPLIPVELINYSPAEGYVRAPADTTGLVEIRVDASVDVCQSCGLVGATKSKHTTRKRDNPCCGATISPETRRILRWARKLEWKPSNTALVEYATSNGHRMVLKKSKDGLRPTFDKDALPKMLERYPDDPIYKQIRAYREVEKMLGYVGRWSEEKQSFVKGWKVWKDGRIHTTFTHTPNTFRLASQDPNMQQIPQRGTYAKLVRSIFPCEPDDAV